jgi:membrane-associated phospholipid phosphatase
MLVHGLQVTEQAITHVANDPAWRAPRQLSFSSPESMGLWADWVRASVYLTDFFKGLDWEVNRQRETVSLSYGDSTFAVLRRPDMQTFKQQLDYLRQYLDQRPDRSPEVLTQLGFPTPYFAMILGLQGAINRHTLELIALTQVLASHVAMVAKHHLACRRPDRLDATVMPIIPTPAHGSFPSAHATEAFAVAEVLNAFIAGLGRYPDVAKRQALIHKLAERVAVNRTVAGVHYPIDTWAGAILGRAVGQIILGKCGQGGAVQSYSYVANGTKDFFLKEFLKGSNHRFGVTRAGRLTVRRSPEFVWLWTEARKEFV